MNEQKNSHLMPAQCQVEMADKRRAEEDLENIWISGGLSHLVLSLSLSFNAIRLVAKWAVMPGTGSWRERDSESNTIQP